MDKPEYHLVRVVIDENTIRNHDVWEVVDPVWWTADLGADVEEYKQSVEKFTDEQRMMLALCLYVSDIKNHGHEWYFTNAFGNHWPDVLGAFGLLQLSAEKENLQNALGLFDGSPPLTHTERQTQIEIRAIDFRKYDAVFLERNALLRVEKSMTEYVHANPSGFYFSGDINRPRTSSPSSQAQDDK